MSHNTEYISYTRIQQWRKCQCAHWYRYVAGIEKILPEVPLVKGDIVHHMLESYNKKEDYLRVLDEARIKYDQLFAEQQEQYGDIIDTCERIMSGYVRTYKDDGLIYDLIEEPVKMPMYEPDELDYIRSFFIKQGKEFPEQVYFVGKVDGVAHEKSGMSYVVEHKVKSAIPEPGSEMNDLQTVLYLKALKVMGFGEPKGILWDYIRSKAPVIPEPLKTGGLSKAKAQDTDYYTYCEALRKYNLDPASYKDILDYLITVKASTFYKRTILPAVKPVTALKMWEDVQYTAMQIAVDGPTARVKNITRDCKFCSYRDLCEAEILDNGVEQVLRGQYRKKEKVSV